MRQILAAAAAALVLWFTVPAVSGVVPRDPHLPVATAMPDPWTAVLLLGALGLIAHCTRRRREHFLQSFIRRKS